ncbi:glycosyltransferase [Cytobacillus firmus]|uniref:galactosyltransferase-related protein n=1 Tax=Cytobacillus firmus TaxID=1399 RepID=UPI00384B56F8
MISVIMPFYSDDGQRKLAFKWASQYYKKILPNSEMIIPSSTIPFNKAKAVNQAAKNAKGEILIIVDADIICCPQSISRAIKMLENTSWIIPYNKVLDITRKSTRALLQTKADWPLSLKVDAIPRETGKVIPVGGINVMKRACFEAAGGFDERFQGWGGEDDALAAAMNTFCGHYKRIDQSIYHLWHPRSKPSDNQNYKANLELAVRYCKAQGNKSEMRKIIQERGNS